MIPQVAGTIIDKYGMNCELLFDPYCGTGTSCVEANLRNINAIGIDLNPLARLITTVKTTELEINILDGLLLSFEHDVRLSDDIIRDNIPQNINTDFWFDKDVQQKLSTIKHYINEIQNVDYKNFFKIAFSETVRDCSWTRNSEFKLYRMTKESMARFNPDVYKIMADKLYRNRNGLRNYIHKKANNSNTVVSDFNTVYEIDENIVQNESIDILVTSPPYGDSRTTVAYGQFSRLSNEWLDLNGKTDIDNIMMGSDKNNIEINLKILNNVLDEIASKDEKRAKEVEWFYSDYYKSIVNVSKLMKNNSYCCYVVGNRTVKGVQLPTDEITRKFFEKVGFKHIETIIRNIPNKRMPARNSPTNEKGVTMSTMNNEYIVIMRKAD